MTRQIIFAAALTAGLALVPVIYVHSSWPSVLAFVPIHYTSAGVPGHFVERGWLRDISWLPGLAWVILTFLPQVHAGQTLFWSSQRQRRTRLVIVASLALLSTSIVYRGAHHSRAQRDLPPTSNPALAR